MSDFICKHCGSTRTKINKTRPLADGSITYSVKCKDCGKYSSHNDGNIAAGITEKTNGHSSKRLTKKDFLTKYDLKIIVYDYLKGLPRDEMVSQQQVEIDCEVRKFQSYKRVFESSELSKFKGKVRGEVWWSHPETISELKSEGILL